MEENIRRVIAELDDRPIINEGSGESLNLKSYRHKLDRFLTKAQYILVHDGDEMHSKKKKELKEMIDKISKLRKRAINAKTESEAKQIYKDCIKQITPYTKNGSFVKFLKDYGIYIVTGGIIGGVLASLTGSLATIISAAVSGGDEKAITMAAYAGSTVGADAGVAGGRKATREINHEGRKKYLRDSGKSLKLKEEYFNY